MRDEPEMEEGEIRDVVTDAEDKGVRLDRVLARHLPDLSRSRLQGLIRDGRVDVGGRTITDPGAKVDAGANCRLTLPPPEDATPQPEAIPLTVLHEDADVIVLDKPAGLVVHPAAGHGSGTLVNALLHHCGDSLSGIGGVRRPGIVHRLDKETSGVMVACKNDCAHKNLAAQFADHGREGDLEREYLAICWGVPGLVSGSVDAPLDRHPSDRERMAVRKGGREAITHWRRLETFADRHGRPVASLIACQLETGRTHQIRVHMAHIGHPLLGDPVYGPGYRTKAATLDDASQAALLALNRQALHAHLLGFNHPKTGEAMQFSSEPPADFAALLEALRMANK